MQRPLSFITSRFATSDYRTAFNSNVCAEAAYKKLPTTYCMQKMNLWLFNMRFSHILVRLSCQVFLVGHRIVIKYEYNIVVTVELVTPASYVRSLAFDSRIVFELCVTYFLNYHLFKQWSKSACLHIILTLFFEKNRAQKWTANILGWGLLDYL